MTIAYDNATMGTLQSAGSSMTLSHTVNSSSNNIVLIGAISNDNIGDAVTGITYNGVSATFVTSIKDPTESVTGRWLDLYYVVGAATGAHNAVVSASAAMILQMMVVSYTGAHQTTPINNSGTADPQLLTDYAVTTTPGVANCWGVMFTWANINFGDTIAAGTNISTLRNYSSTSGKQNIAVGDSNATISSGSGYTMHMTISTVAFGTAIGISLAPAPVSAKNTGFFLAAAR